MKSIIKVAVILFVSFAISGCLKDKNNDPVVEEPIPLSDPPEVITTIRLSITDSADVTQTPKFYAFKDPDGDGGTIGTFQNESGTYDTIMLLANHTYITRVYILDESKIPTDSTSNVIAGEESGDHMLFYNGDPAATGGAGNTILNAFVPYTVKTNVSDITIQYLDIDNGSPQRNIGLQTRWRTAGATSAVNPLIVTLRHQPGAKNGSYAPGETDVMITFKVKVN